MIAMKEIGVSQCEYIQPMGWRMTPARRMKRAMA
jgi:hypothetical protein